MLLTDKTTLRADVVTYATEVWLQEEVTAEMPIKDCYLFFPLLLS